jgi:outer membrane protein
MLRDGHRADRNFSYGSIFTLRSFRLKKNVVISLMALSFAFAAAAQTAAPPAGSGAPAAKPAGAPAVVPTKIAIINVQKAIVDTKDGQKAAAELQTKFNPRKAALEKRQSDIQSMQEQLRKGAATMSEEAQARMNKDIETNQKSLQRDAQDLNDDVDQEQGKLMQEIGGKLMQVVEQYATQNGYAVVLDVSNQQSPVLWASASTDITADITRLYDQAHPSSAAAPTGVRAPVVPAPKPATPPASNRPAVPPAVKKQ